MSDPLAEHLHMPRLLRRNDKWCVEIAPDVYVVWWFVGKTAYISADGVDMYVGGVVHEEDLEREGLNR